MPRAAENRLGSLPAGAARFNDLSVEGARECEGEEEVVEKLLQFGVLLPTSHIAFGGIAQQLRD